MRLEFRLGDSRGCVRCEDHGPRLRCDPRSLVRAVDDAREDTFFIVNEHVAGFEGLLPTAQHGVLLRPKRHIDNDPASHHLKVMPRGQDLVLELSNVHRLDKSAWPRDGLAFEEDGLQLKLNMVGLAEALAVGSVGLQSWNGEKLRGALARRRG